MQLILTHGKSKAARNIQPITPIHSCLSVMSDDGSFRRGVGGINIGILLVHLGANSICKWNYASAMMVVVLTISVSNENNASIALGGVVVRCLVRK